MKRKRVFSGIQPSGFVHLGNYIGALQTWARLQNEFECLYSIVDLHAITVPQNPEELRRCIRRTVATTLAVGIDPDQSIIFVQSDVPEHAELAWILNCFVYFGELSRMTQFKDKSSLRGVGTSTGLFTYPVLMAADILLYDTHAVPVGDDQRQHLELARMTANRMNKQFPELFVVPEPIIGQRGARIMGLDNPLVKMSKSASSEYNYISFSDSPDDIRRKFKKAVTDSDARVAYDEDKKPAVSNLLAIYSACSGETVETLVRRYEGRGYGDFKKDLAEAVIAKISPLQRHIDTYLADVPQLDSILSLGAEKARALATPKLLYIRKLLGLGR